MRTWSRKFLVIEVAFLFITYVAVAFMFDRVAYTTASIAGFFALLTIITYRRQ